jgi:hypothetical protein
MSQKLAGKWTYRGGGGVLRAGVVCLWIAVWQEAF